MSKIFLCLIILLGLYNCETYKGVKVYDVTSIANGGNKVDLNVLKEEEFALKFKGNPTTGFTWVLLNADSINRFFEAVNFDSKGSGEYVADSNEMELDGSGGNFYYIFKAIKISNEAQSLNFSYRRPWAKPTNDEPTIVVKVTIS